MRKWIGLAVCLCAVAWAQEPAGNVPGAATTAQVRAQHKAITGNITALDAAAGRLTVKSTQQELRFTTNQATRVLIAADPGSLSNLATGQRVRVNYRLEGAAPYLATAIMDADSIKWVQEEAEGVPSTIDSITPATETEPAGMALTTVRGKKRTLTVPLTSVLLRDGGPVGLEAFKPGDQVVLQIRRGGKVDAVKSLSDQATYVALLQDRPTQVTVVEAPAGVRFKVQQDGSDQVLPARFTRGAMIVKGGQVVNADKVVAGDLLYVRAGKDKDGTIAVRAAFTKDDWRAFADAWQARQAERDRRAAERATKAAEGAAAQ